MILDGGSRKGGWWVLIGVLGAVSAEGSEAQAEAADGGILIEGVPHVVQQPDFCGEACVAMYLQKLGHDVTQEHVFNRSGVDPALGRGCVTREMVRVLKRIGFEPGAVWYAIGATRSASELDKQWKALLADLRKGIPSIVCMHYDERPDATEHFRLIVGYDPGSDEAIYHEPARDNGAYQRMKRSRFVKCWPLKVERRRRMVIRMRLKAGTLSPGEPAAGFTNADYAQHIMDLRPRVPKDFTMIIQRPFVVIGDESPAVVRQRAERTVEWFVDRVRKLYFEKDPPEIYDIWLFKDETSYRKHTKSLFNEEPGTPFGYFSHTEGALIMNIATGGGTLCHEIVHAFVESNFPGCPAWFNEGLASLYEQCGERNGRVVGLTNWRLAGLKKQIRTGVLPSFKKLLSTTTQQFYNMDTADNYAQARYLCYYLQEKGLLGDYYRAFCGSAKRDACGYAALREVLSIEKEEEMAGFQKRWEKWVLRLRFP